MWSSLTMPPEIISAISLPADLTGFNAVTRADQTLCGDDRFEFLSPAWYAAWVLHHVPGDRWRAPVKVFRVVNGEDNLGEMLFATQAMSIVRIMALGGYYWPFRGACLDVNRLSATLFAELMAQQITQGASNQMLRMAPVIANDSVILSLCEQLRRHGWSQFSREIGRVFELEFALTENELKAKISSSMLRNVLYMQRRIEKEIGPVTWRRYAGSEITSEVIDQAASIEELSWVYAKNGDVKLVGARNKSFWQHVINSPELGCDVVLWILYVNANPAAFSFHLETKRTAFILANGYVQEMHRYSLGSVLTYRVFLDAVKRGTRRLDWGSGDSGYKQKWGAAAGATLHEHLLFRPTLLGKAGAFIFERFASGWGRVR